MDRDEYKYQALWVVLFKCYWFPISKIVNLIGPHVLYTGSSVERGVGPAHFSTHSHSALQGRQGRVCTRGTVRRSLVTSNPTHLADVSPDLSADLFNCWCICLITERQIAVITRLHAMNESTTYLRRIGLLRVKYTLALHHNPTPVGPCHPSW